ncbi:serine/threonine protein kinase [Mycobacterium sp. MS1601]|uniref:serine/threonine-protein kinase n=1 Tax=Mycobacterium sp. MS1601 TaxID=1936029 RepID=UPI00097981E8|nr:serine/threonine-protein kinase [Mycobacterium sp. MS1601]AQA06727.1 serine/threonine protein kinase [Mycobacterium sp. MS1601]
MPLADGATFAGYTIIRLLGAGGMGEVYLAQHPRLPREDALKVLPPSVSTDREFRERFEREADLAAGLWHPHIVGVHDRGEFEGQLWISMDYVDGTDAGVLLRRQPGGLAPEHVVAIVSAVADALDYAHDRQLLHRDVKPANILITSPDSGNRRIMLADFGIARRADEASGLTATNMTVGTVSYAAPEQLMGNPLDGRADQYALAATAFHLLTGAPPFQHTNPAVVISQHLTARPPSVSERKPELAHLDSALGKALAKDPADRYARCLDFARALAHQVGVSAPVPAVSGGPGSTEETRLATAAQEQPSARGWARPAVLVPVVLALLLVVAVAFAVGEFTADKETGVDARTTTAPLPPPPPVTTDTDVVTETETETATATTTTATTTTATTSTANTTPAAAATAAVGAECSEAGATGVTADGATVYCANLQYTDRYLWSTSPGQIANPVLSTSPTTPVPFETESPVRICMEQTGHSRLRCAEDILRGNGG